MPRFTAQVTLALAVLCAGGARAVHENPWFKFIWSLEAARVLGEAEEQPARDSAFATAIRAALSQHGHAYHNRFVLRLRDVHNPDGDVPGDVNWADLPAPVIPAADVPLTAAQVEQAYATLLRSAFVTFVTRTWPRQVEGADAPADAVATRESLTLFATNMLQLGHVNRLDDMPGLDSDDDPFSWALPHRWGFFTTNPSGLAAITAARLVEATSAFRQEPQNEHRLAQGFEFVSSPGHTRALFVRVARTDVPPVMFAVKGSGVDCSRSTLVDTVQAWREPARALCRTTAFSVNAGGAPLLPLKYNPDGGEYKTVGYIAAGDAAGEMDNFHNVAEQLGALADDHVLAPIRGTLPRPAALVTLVDTPTTRERLEPDVAEQIHDNVGHAHQFSYFVRYGESPARLPRAMFMCPRLNQCHGTVAPALKNTCPGATPEQFSRQGLAGDQYQWKRAIPALADCAAAAEQSAAVGDAFHTDNLVDALAACAAALENADGALQMKETTAGTVVGGAVQTQFASAAGWRYLLADEREEWGRAIAAGLAAVPVPAHPVHGEAWTPAEGLAHKWLGSLWSDLALFVRLGLASTGFANSFEGRNFVLSVRDGDEWGLPLGYSVRYGLPGTSAHGDLIDAARTAAAILWATGVDCDSRLYTAVNAVRTALLLVVSEVFGCQMDNAEVSLVAPLATRCVHPLKGHFCPVVGEEVDEVWIGFDHTRCAGMPAQLRAICEAETAIDPVPPMPPFRRGGSFWDGNTWYGALDNVGDEHHPEASARLSRVLQRSLAEYVRAVANAHMPSWALIFAAAALA